jgi:hypothetical protein
MNKESHAAAHSRHQLRHPRCRSSTARRSDRRTGGARRRRPGRSVDHHRFGNDQERAPADKHQRNLAWLSGRPFIGTLRGAFRLDYSRLGIDTALVSEEQKVVAMTIDEIMLPKAYRVGKLRADDEALMAKWRRKATISSILSRISSPATTPSSPATTTCSKSGPNSSAHRDRRGRPRRGRPDGAPATLTLGARSPPTTVARPAADLDRAGALGHSFGPATVPFRRSTCATTGTAKEGSLSGV